MVIQIILIKPDCTFEPFGIEFFTLMKILGEIMLWMFTDCFLFLKISGNYTIHLGNISKIH